VILDPLRWTRLTRKIHENTVKMLCRQGREKIKLSTTATVGTFPDGRRRQDTIDAHPFRVVLADKDFAQLGGGGARAESEPTREFHIRARFHLLAEGLNRRELYFNLKKNSVREEHKQKKITNRFITVGTGEPPSIVIYLLGRELARSEGSSRRGRV